MKDVAKELPGMTLDYQIETDCTIMKESLNNGSRQFVHLKMIVTNESGTKCITNSRFWLTKNRKYVLCLFKAENSNLDYYDGMMVNVSHSKYIL